MANSGEMWIVLAQKAKIVREKQYKRRTSTSFNETRSLGICERAVDGDPLCKLVQFAIELGSFFIRGGITSASAIPEC